MKIFKYALSNNAVLVREKCDNVYKPLFYLRRPKWITDDAAWRKICESVRVNLPKNFEVN